MSTARGPCVVELHIYIYIYIVGTYYVPVHAVGIDAAVNTQKNSTLPSKSLIKIVDVTPVMKLRIKIYIYIYIHVCIYRPLILACE